MGYPGDGRGRLHLKGRADHKEKITLLRATKGTHHLLLGHGLSERNRSGLYQAVAFIAPRFEINVLYYLLDILDRPALSTLCFPVRPVKFDHNSARIPAS